MLDDLTGWIEMHIEQARVLQDTGNRIGIVNAIAGYVHADVIVHGRGDHAGATPMDLRLDPTLPLAETVLELERLAPRGRHGTVGTVGEIEVDPGLINAIASRVRFSLDVRGPVDDAFRGVAREIAAFAERAPRRGACAPSVAAAAGTAGDAARRADRRRSRGGRDGDRRAVHAMHSGAAHDTMCVADRVPSAMVFVPCRDGISHHRPPPQTPPRIILPPPRAVGGGGGGGWRGWRRSSPAGEGAPRDLWPFALAGVLVPGVSQLVFVQAIRLAGAVAR